MPGLLEAQVKEHARRIALQGAEAANMLGGLGGVVFTPEVGTMPDITLRWFIDKPQAMAVSGPQIELSRGVKMSRLARPCPGCGVVTKRTSKRLVCGVLQCPLQGEPTCTLCTRYIDCLQLSLHVPIAMLPVTGRSHVRQLQYCIGTDTWW